MTKILEVIVTSPREAIEAEAGGADRLELVRSLEVGGLSPSLETVRAVLGAVSIPVRVMVRNTPDMIAGSGDALEHLQQQARAFGESGVDGIVAGFLSGKQIDLPATKAIAEAAQCPITFHRAFDEVADPLSAIETLKRIPRVDRILTSGDVPEWGRRKRQLLEWQSAAAPNIKLLVGAGLSSEIVSEIRNGSGLDELHVGRAARVPQTVAGRVDRAAIRALKSRLV